MTKNEYEQLTAAQPQPAIKGALLENQTARTLIYGYTADRNTFHVYLGADGLLHRVVYDGDDFLLSYDNESKLVPQNFVPDKRVYPECCDLEFCRILMRAEVSIPFMAFNESDVPSDDFIGSRREDLLQVDPDDHLAPINITLAEIGLELEPRLSGFEPRLVEALSMALCEMLDAPYRRAKYKTGYAKNLKLWLHNVPTNVEHEVQSWLDDALPYLGVAHQHKIPEELARALVEKVTKAVYQQLKEPTVTA